MSANNDEPEAVNGRLRPRKPSIAFPSPARSTSLRRSLKNDRNREKSVNKTDPPSSLEFLCPYCDKKFASKKSASKHVGSRHFQQASDVACQFCDHGECDPLQVMRHMHDAHPDHYFACLDCRTRFNTSNELKAHKINLCRKLKPPGKSYPYSLCRSIEKNETKKIIENEDFQQELEDESGFKGIVIACELKPTQIEDPADIESSITTNLILPTNNSLVSSSGMAGKGPVLVIDEVQWNKRMAGTFSFHKSEADQILSRLGVVHRSPGAAAAIPRSQTYNYIEETTKFEKCFDTVFYSKVASNVQENLEKFLDGSFNRIPLDPDSIIKTRKSKNNINTAEGFPILLSSEQFSRTVFGAYLPRAIAPRHKWKRDSIENEKHIISADQLIRDSHVNNCIVSLVSSLDIWTQICMRRKFEDKYNNISFNERKTEKQNIICNELKEILESRELPARALPNEKCDIVATRPVPGMEFPMSLGLRATPPLQPPPPALLSGEWVRPRCFVCCACGEYTRDPKALIAHFNAQHPTANVSHYDIAGELLCKNDSIIKHLYVPSNIAPNRTRPPRGIRDCTKCGKSITLEELHQHMLECAGDTPVVKRKCRYRPFGVRRRRPRMPDNTMRKKIHRTMVKRKTMHKNKIRSHSTLRSEVGDAETIRKMIADLPAKRHRAPDGSIAAAQHRNRKRDTTLNKLLRNRPTNCKHPEKQHSQKDQKNSLKGDPKVKKKGKGNTSKNVQSNSLTSRPVSVTSRILRKTDMKRKNALRRSPRSTTQPIGTHNEKQNPIKSSVLISSEVQTDALSLHASSDRADVNRSRGRSSEHAARSNSGSSRPSETQRAGDTSANTNSANNNNNNHNQQDSRPLIKHSIARLTATTETHDKAVQFQPHFLVNQECSKSSSKPYMLSEPQVFYENDIMAARLDKPPLINYNQQSPVDPYACQKSKLNKPRKKLNDCIAMLKNKLEEPPPPMERYSMHETIHDERDFMCETVRDEQNSMRETVNDERDSMLETVHDERDSMRETVHDERDSMRETVHDERDSMRETVHDERDSMCETVHDEQDCSVMPLRYAKLEMMTPLNMIPDGQYDVPNPIPYAHENTTAPLDLSGKRSTNNESFSTDYESLDLSQRHFINLQSDYPYDIADEDVVVDLCTKSVHYEESLDLSKRSTQFDESLIPMMQRTYEARPIEPPPPMKTRPIEPPSPMMQNNCEPRPVEPPPSMMQRTCESCPIELPPPMMQRTCESRPIELPPPMMQRTCESCPIELPPPMMQRTCESCPMEPPPLYDYDLNAYQYYNNTNFHLTTDLGYPQQALDYNLENRTMIRSIPPGYSRELEYERITEANILHMNMISPNLARQQKTDHRAKKVREYHTSAQSTALANSARSKGDKVDNATLENNNKINRLESEAAVDDTAKKIALLPKEIVEILGKMPSDHRNQLLDVLPQYLGCNTSVKQLKMVVDIHPEPLASPIATIKSASNEIAPQKLTSSVNSASAQKEKHSIESTQEYMQKNALLTENICVNTQDPHVNTQRLHVNNQGTHVNTHDLHVNTQGPRISNRGPHVNTQRPHVSSQDPHANTQGPCVTNQSTHVNIQDLRVITQGPRGSIQDPHANTQHPHANTQGPRVNHQGTHVNTQDLHANSLLTEKIHVSTQGSHENTQGPWKNSKDLHLNTQSPRVNTHELHASTQRSRVNTHDPHENTQGPGVNTQDLHENTEGPRLNTHDPHASTQCLRAFIHDPHANTQGPRVNNQDLHENSQGPHLNTLDPHANTQGLLANTQGTSVNTQYPHVIKQSSLANTQEPIVNTQGPLISCGVIHARDPISLQNIGLNKDILTGYTAVKPKEVKEKTASSLRAVRIKTSSQRRHTQNALEIKQTDHVPILSQPLLLTPDENIVIQQSEISITQHNAISVNNLLRYPSHDMANLKRYPLHQSDAIKKLETDKNKTAPLSIVDVSACNENEPLLEKNEQNVKEAIDKEGLPELSSKNTIIKNIEAPTVEVSDGDSEDDVSLAVIFKQKMSERQKTVNAKVKSDSPSRQRNTRITRKRINDDNFSSEIDPENKKHTTTSTDMLDSLSKETITCAQDTDINVGKNSPAPETHSFYLGKKLRTRSIWKEVQPNGIEQRPIQNETEAHSNLDNLQNKENNDQTHTNIAKHLSNSENLTIDIVPRELINEQKDNEPPIAKLTQVSCETLQDIEVIKPNDVSKSKRRIKDKKVGKQKTVEFQESIKKQDLEPINIVKINRNNSPVLSVSKKTDVMTCISSTKNYERATTTINCNKPSDDDHNILISQNLSVKSDDSESQSVTNPGKKAHSNKKLRRSRRGKSKIIEIQANSQKRRDSPMISSVSNDFEFDDAKSCSNSYVEQIDPALPPEKRLTEINAKSNSINKDILDNVETKFEDEINICKSSSSLRKKKPDTNEHPCLKSPIVDIKPENKVPSQESKTCYLTQNVSPIISMEKENTENISAEDKIMSPTTTVAVFDLRSVTEKNKSMKQKKKSKSVGERKNKNQASKLKKTTKSCVESSSVYPKQSEKPNLCVVSTSNLSMSPSETKKSSTCYNIPRTSAPTRPKSSLSKSEDGNSVNYDPYDIDQEDNLLEKISLLKKTTSISKSFPEEMLPKPLQDTESNNFTYEETLKLTSTLSDSDDSSKSDVPLKKLVDEKDNKKNKLIKSVKSQEKERTTPVTSDAHPSTLSEDESLRSEQFMESFGFFSERRPRKSNIIAAKKISETFQNDDSNEQSSKTMNPSKSVSNIISADFPIKCSVYCTAIRNNRGRKLMPSKDLTFSYCSLCEKAFRRQDNYLRHVMSYFHITKVLQKEMNITIEPIPEQPNCLIIYRQHIERIKRLTEKIIRKNKKLGITCSPPKFELPSLAEIMAEAKLHIYSGPDEARHGLSRDEALFLDCCELLKESCNKNEPIETVTLDAGVSPHRELVNPIDKIIAEDRADSKSDGDVDSITAKAILESDEVQILEHDFLCGLKEAAEKRQLEINNQTQTPNGQSLDNFDLDLDNEPVVASHLDNEPVDASHLDNEPAVASHLDSETAVASHLDNEPAVASHLDNESAVVHTPVAEDMFHSTVSEQVIAKPPSPKPIDSCSEVLVIVEKKPKKSKTKVTTEIAFDIYEDKFDKIKRKCRSQAAAAKVPPPLTEPSTSSKTKKKSDTKKNKKSPKNVKQNTIPTKGALKGFECIKLSESVDNASSSEPGYEPTPPSKRKKSSHSNKRERKASFKSSTKPHCSNVLPRTRADIYEFLDNDDSNALKYRRSPPKDKFKTFKDTPSTSKADPMPQAYESSASASDVDDFVYMSDDYLCSADETENSLLSSEAITNCKKPSKRKEALEKNAVMGKIFKNNAVRNERKPSSSSKETTKASKANLDQLFDSLLEDEPNSSMLKEDTDFPSSNRALSSAVVVAGTSAATTGSQSCDDSLFNSPPRDQTTKRKKSRDNKRTKQKRSKIHFESALEGSSYKKVKKRFSGEERLSTEDGYGVDKSYKKVKKRLSGEERLSTEDGYSVNTSYKKVKKRFSGEERLSTEDGYGVDKSYKKLKKRLSGEEKVSTEDGYGVDTSYKKVKKRSSGEEKVSTEDGFGVETSYKKVKKRLSGEQRLSTEDGYGVDTSYKKLKKRLSGEEKVLTEDGYGVDTSYKKVKKRLSGEEKVLTEDEYGVDTSYKKVKKRLSGEKKLSTEDGYGVAQHRARRACAVGKQNVLAETWSSESESDSLRATAAEAAAHSRKNRSKKNKHSASRQSKHVSFEKYEKESEESPRVVDDDGGEPARKSFEKRNGRESRGRSRSQIAYVYSSEEGEDAHPQQHGWIVGNSHKKLVTMLAHAKGRKRDDKRSYID